MPHQSRWCDFAPPDSRVSDIGEAGIFFGAQLGWDGRRDHTMGTQDPATGLWSLGSQRRAIACPHCGNDPAKGVYCERCASVSSVDEPKLAAQRIADREREAALERERRSRSVQDKIDRLKRRAEKARNLP